MGAINNEDCLKITPLEYQQGEEDMQWFQF